MSTNVIHGLTSGHTAGRLLIFWYHFNHIFPRLVPTVCCPDLSGGGVPGGALDWELVLDFCLFCKGGTQAKQTLPGHGPKLASPQLLHGGVGGGVQGDEPLLSRVGCCGAAGV